MQEIFYIFYILVYVQPYLYLSLWERTMVCGSIHSFSRSELLAPVPIPLKCQPLFLEG